MKTNFNSRRMNGFFHRIKWIPALCLAAGLFFAPPARGQAPVEVLFEDNFNVSGNVWDINFEYDDPGRQSGSVAPLLYTERPETAPGGFFEDLTQLETWDYPGKLVFYVLDPVWVSPEYNFTDGGRFTIEFDVHPGASHPGRDSDDWAAVIFGASTQGSFVNASDGMGILFRNNGEIQVFDGGAAIYGGDGDLAGGLPEGEFRVRIEVETEHFRGGSPASVSLFVNDTPVRIHPETFDHVKEGGFFGNFITLQGIGNNMIHTFDNLKISAVTCVNPSIDMVQLSPGETSEEITVKIPAHLNVGQAVQVRVTSSNPAVAAPEGAVDGELVLNFAAGGALTQTFQVTALGKGGAVLELSSDAEVCIGGSVSVRVLTALVENPSFESNYNPTWPHYSPIDGWSGGGTGVNTQSGPFHDNGIIPDGERVGFKQGGGSLSQLITGLIPGEEYWLQFRYNTRNCCGERSLDLSVAVDGFEVDAISNIQPAGGGEAYFFRNVPFTAVWDEALIEFSAFVTGDATLLIDAVTVVRRGEGHVLVQNPSFEASGEPPFPGYMSRISGWTGSGNFGVNLTGSGPFADNGTNPDQDLVAFIQDGGSSLAQNISGLIEGEEYVISYAYNARSGNSPQLRVMIGDILIQDEEVSPVGGNEPYHTHSFTFTATSSLASLSFTQTAEGDHTVLLDDIQIVGRTSTFPCITVSPGRVDATLGEVKPVSITIPAQLNESSAATVLVTAQDPNVALPEGAGNGTLSLTFAAGGETTQSFNVVAVGRGSALITVSSPDGVCVDQAVTVNVTGSYVRNPSFEADEIGGWPGYGSIQAWSSTGNSGLNPVDEDGPFHDNGQVPDRGQVAFVQGGQTFSQSTGGLVPGQLYWLQFYFNTRDCCGERRLDLTVQFGGEIIDTIEDIQPVGPDAPYYFRNVPFTPTAGSGTLEFVTAVEGDATLLLDAISIVAAEPELVLVRNPSFEASGAPPFPGYMQPDPLAGWTAVGQYGVNVSGAGPFADNGSGSDQDSVAFLQGISSISQMIADLEPGQVYTLGYIYNARSGNSPRLRVTMGDVVLRDETVVPVGGTAPYHSASVTFVAGDVEELLTFEQTAEGDQTVLLDAVRISPGGEAPAPRLGAERVGNQIRIVWPSEATGFVLESAPAITGPWAELGDAPEQQNGQQVITRPMEAGSGFYRLRKTD